MSQSSEEDERQKEGGREKRGCRCVVVNHPNSATSVLSLLLFTRANAPTTLFLTVQSPPPPFTGSLGPYCLILD